MAEEETHWVSASEPISGADYIFAPADQIIGTAGFTVNRLFFFRRPLAVQPLRAALERVLSRVPLLAGRVRESRRLEQRLQLEAGMSFWLRAHTKHDCCGAEVSAGLRWAHEPAL